MLGFVPLLVTCAIWMPSHALKLQPAHESTLFAKRSPFGFGFDAFDLQTPIVAAPIAGDSSGVPKRSPFSINIAILFPVENAKKSEVGGTAAPPRVAPAAAALGPWARTIDRINRYNAVMARANALSKAYKGAMLAKNGAHVKGEQTPKKRSLFALDGPLRQYFAMHDGKLIHDSNSDLKEDEKRSLFALDGPLRQYFAMHGGKLIPADDSGEAKEKRSPFGFDMSDFLNDAKDESKTKRSPFALNMNDILNDDVFKNAKQETFA